MGSTAYSKQDVQEARDGLKLLKSRMRDSQRLSFNNGSSHSARRQNEDPNFNKAPSYTNSDKGPTTRKSQYRPGNSGASANKPPMPNASSGLYHSHLDSTGEQ